ncbi:MAG: aldo/keto reductase, partial [Bacteroidales bacterium]|nr:aldo/keto reductase [Bacteroidales bacterium]
MKYTKLGKNGSQISTVGFGAWGISGQDWGKTDDKESMKALHHALDKGVTFIDTADTYGFGHSEELIAKVIKERGKSDNLLIATKAGNDFYPYLENQNKHKITPINPNYSKEYLISAAEKSLKRLGVETLDVLQLHSPGTELLERDEPWEALETLKKQGKIKLAGWSVQSFMEIEQAFILERHHDLIDVIQVRYNLLERDAEKELFPLALKYGTGVIIRIPILFGLLAGKFNRNSRFGKDDHRNFNLSPEKLSAYLDKLDKMKDFFDKYKDYSYAQLSLRFCIAHPAADVVIPGMKTIKQVEENIIASDLDFIRFEDFP